jgi:hypothetical protein
VGGMLSEDQDKDGLEVGVVFRIGGTIITKIEV